MISDIEIPDIPEVPIWYTHMYNKSLEYMQPVGTILSSISLVMYGYIFLGIVVLTLIYFKLNKLRKRRSSGKRRRRHGKSYKQTANKNSTINADPLLQ